MSVHRLPRVVSLPPIALGRLAGPVLVREGDAPWPPPGWEVGTREPCAGGHPASEECDLCRGECIGGVDVESA